MRAVSLFALFLPILLAGCGPRYEVVTTRVPLALGDSTVTLVLHEAGAPGLTYLNLHDDENTSVEAALRVIGEWGGRVIELQQSGRRNLAFAVDDTVYAVDPNRLFTDAGRTASLDTLSAATDTARAAVGAFARALLDRYALDALGVIVTLHNNTDDRYSTLSYIGDGDYAGEALFAHLSAEHDPDDFFFVTDLDLYNALRSDGFNVVLQDNARATDDGSLSVYAAQLGVPYVNVEAEHGHLRQQIEMIEHLHRLLAAAEAPAP